MKFTFSALSFFALLISCGPSKKGMAHSSTSDSLTLDTSGLVHEENKAYVFFDSIAVFDIDIKGKMTDYLYFGDSVVLTESFSMLCNQDMLNMNEVEFSYHKNNQRKKGKAIFNGFALSNCRSHKDPLLRYFANIVMENDEMRYVKVKMVRNRTVVDEYNYNMGGTEEGYQLNIHCIDSLHWTGADEIVSCDWYQGYGSFDYRDTYLLVKDQKMTELMHYSGNVAGDELDYCSFYFPYQYKGKWLMAGYNDHGVVRDSTNKVNGKKVPAEFLSFVPQLVYIENTSSTYITDEKDEVKLDDHGNPQTREEMVWTLWLKWNGTSLDTLKTKNSNQNE
jgi:hypothetical protein